MQPLRATALYVIILLNRALVSGVVEVAASNDIEAAAHVKAPVNTEA